MKRALVFFLVALWTWGLAPVGANSVPIDAVIVSCTGVGFEWHDFPAHPVDLHVTVTWRDEQTVATVSTEGERHGAGTVPLALEGDGTASVTVSWQLQKPHQSGPVTADLSCSSTATTRPTTTTTPPTSPPPSPPSTPPSPECGPGTLACTGPTSTDALVVGGAVLLALGAFLAAIAGGRRAR